MHALVRKGDGKYYVSAVFGYYNNIKSNNDYERYLESIHSPYYIIWDEKKEHLIKWFAMTPNTKYLIPQLIIIDTSENDWVINNEGIGGVDFLPKEMADQIVESGEMPQEIRERCLALDNDFVYEEYSEIRSETDIKNLECASGGFHDAYIKEQKLQNDGTLYLLFDGVWGCKIEIWFWEDLEYDTSSLDSEDYVTYWYDSTVFFQNGFIYLVDGEDMTADKISKGYCWFKARHMKYHIIPN